MSLDINLFYFFNNLAEKSQLFDAIIIFLAQYLQYFLIAFFLLLLFFSHYNKRQKIYMFLVAVFSAIVARLGVTEIIRFFYHRPRPFISLHVSQLFAESGWSFPSGHSAFFFAMAFAIYFYNKKWGMAFLIASIIMNVSRIIAGVHYPSDILGGAVVGYAVAYFIFYFLRKKEAEDKNNSNY